MREVKRALSGAASSANWQSFLQGKWRETVNGAAALNSLHVSKGSTPEQSEADGASLKLSGLPVARLDDLLWQVGKPCRVESVALRTSAGDELVEERDRFLTRILTFILHHACLQGTKHKLKWKSGGNG